jgi:hypothetical protein
MRNGLMCEIDTQHLQSRKCQSWDTMTNNDEIESRRMLCERMIRRKNMFYGIAHCSNGPPPSYL